MKYLGSLGLDRKRSGCWANATCSAVDPAFGDPMMRKSGKVIATSLLVGEGRGRVIGWSSTGWTTATGAAVGPNAREKLQRSAMRSAGCGQKFGSAPG